MGALCALKRGIILAKIAFTITCVNQVLDAFTVCSIMIALLFYWKPSSDGSVNRLYFNLKFALLYLILALLSVVPFVVWVITLHQLEIPNPFILNSGFNNRHSGSTAILGAVLSLGDFLLGQLSRV